MAYAAGRGAQTMVASGWWNVSGADTDIAIAIETADVVLMRSDPLDVPTAIRIGRGTYRKMRQNLGWAVGYNAVALPIAAGVLAPMGLVPRLEMAALSMSGSSLIVASTRCCSNASTCPRPEARRRWANVEAVPAGRSWTPLSRR